MNSQLGLKEAEKKAFSSFFKDGFWDLYLGILLIGFALGIILSNSNLSKTWVYLILIVYNFGFCGAFLLAKRNITSPRMGIVRYGKKRKKKLKIVSLVLTLSVLFGAVVFIFTLLTTKSAWTGRIPFDLLFPLVWLINAVVVFSLMAYFMDYPRFYLYGFFFGLPLSLDTILKYYFGLRLLIPLIIVPGLIMVAIGVRLLVRFLKTYPVFNDEVLNINEPK